MEIRLFLLYFFQQRFRNTIKVALFNITSDPNEHEDLSVKLPQEVKKLQDRVQYYMNGVVPPGKKPRDPMALKTAREKGCWGPWQNVGV